MEKKENCPLTGKTYYYNPSSIEVECIQIISQVMEEYRKTMGSKNQNAIAAWFYEKYYEKT